jgi:hypothetical protein
MSNVNFTTTFTLDRTPEEAFAATTTFVDGGQETSTATPTNSRSRRLWVSAHA